ncbi:MAG: hypothetical protein EBR30_08890 [Cytophagia bacterium]|nr:hypothetical protein [Cytophagia bacterium]
MKKVIVFFILLLTSYNGYAKGTVVVLITRGEVFSFQIGKIMKGGQVEIYDPAGKLIFTQQIATRKLTIELPELAHGEYLIKMVKHSRDQAFENPESNTQTKVTMQDEITVSLTIKERD